ncbi:MAG: polysaccharide biosynthesis/export family protein [Candidatus Eisenbacteria bacterium]
MIGGKVIRLRLLLAGILSLLVLAGCASSSSSRLDQSMRDFPPLEEPGRSPYRPVEPGSIVPSDSTLASGRTETLPGPGEGTVGETPEPDEDSYRLGVGDEVQILVVGNPEFNRPAKVLPDGSITAPGAGSVYVLGETTNYASSQIQSRLRRLLRHPDVDLLVTAYGEHVVYVTGEVEIGGDLTYRKGMTALQAVAAAGGFKSSANRGQVVVFRRTVDEAEFHQINLKDPLEGENFENDMRLHRMTSSTCPSRSSATSTPSSTTGFGRTSPFTLYPGGVGRVQRDQGPRYHHQQESMNEQYHNGENGHANGSSSHVEEAREVSLRDVLAVVFRHTKGIILGVVLAAVATVVLLNLTSPVEYQSSSTIRVNRGEPESAFNSRMRVLTWEEAELRDSAHPDSKCCSSPRDDRS